MRSSRRRRAWRLLAALPLAAALGATAIVAVDLWQLAHGARLVATARGPVEVAVVGAGPDVLLLHGSPGGYDQMLPLAKLLATAGFRVLAPSRPGYLRTPPSANGTIAEQVEVLAALLDAFAVERVDVAAVSGGGPAALALALAAPERVRTLAMIAAECRWAPAERPPRLGLAFRATAVAAAYVPRLAMPLLGIRDAEARRRFAEDDDALAASRAVFFSLALGDRSAGYRADAMSRFPETTTPPLESLRVPTLVLHGSADANVPFEHAEELARRVAGARLIRIEGGTHAIVVTEIRRIAGAIVEHLTSQGNPR